MQRKFKVTHADRICRQTTLVSVTSQPRHRPTTGQLVEQYISEHNLNDLEADQLRRFADQLAMIPQPSLTGGLVSSIPGRLA
ncbi:Uncharacterised protein [uncultured archaeon]|nr:Uncharacterised protein [uncultured archaeon]